MRPFWIALQFLTRLPVPSQGHISPDEQGRSVLFYPLVGALIGMALVFTAWLAQSQPNILTAALILAVWVVISGALHLDGLADTIDGWIGGQGDHEATMRIMKDPFCGPMGLTAIVVVLLVKFAALHVLLDHGQWAWLLIAPLLARAAVIALFRWTPYVRAQGLGSEQADNLPRDSVAWVLAACALFALIVIGWGALAVLLVAALLFVWLRSRMVQRLGGTTGDTAGAMVEIMEMALLVVLVW
ncbi:MAG: adenosylcobinamide-GDP ribazoletransferase [Pseudomonadota bacterium]|nr:adenosylcobinamide-GDP ribazoletransferase [Pseudomonadota bacterium]